MNDYEVRDLYEQVQCLEVQVQRLVEALMADNCECCTPAKEEAPAEAEDETAADEEE